MIFDPRLKWIHTMRDRCTTGFSSMAGLRLHCGRVELHVIPTLKWLFTTVVTPTIMYASKFWGPYLSHDKWSKVEKVQCSYLRLQIAAKVSVPLPILLGEFAAFPLELDGLFRVSTLLHKGSRGRNTQLAPGGRSKNLQERQWRPRPWAAAPTAAANANEVARAVQ